MRQTRGWSVATSDRGSVCPPRHVYPHPLTSINPRALRRIGCASLWHRTRPPQIWDRTVAGFQEVCDAFPDLKVSLEYKPTDENTRFFAVPSTGASLWLLRDVNRPNMGLTLDIGHCLMAGENPAQVRA